jgi:hypothetical protein
MISYDILIKEWVEDAVREYRNSMLVSTSIVKGGRAATPEPEDLQKGEMIVDA